MIESFSDDIFDDVQAKRIDIVRLLPYLESHGVLNASCA